MTQLQSVGLMISIWPTLSRDGSSVNGGGWHGSRLYVLLRNKSGTSKKHGGLLSHSRDVPQRRIVFYHDYVVSRTDIKLCFDIRGYVSWPPCGCDQWQFHGRPSRMFPWLGIVQRSHERAGRSGRLRPTGLFDVLDLQKQHKPSSLLLEKG